MPNNGWWNPLEGRLTTDSPATHVNPNTLKRQNEVISSFENRPYSFDPPRALFAMTVKANEYVNTAAAAMRGMPKLTATWAAITELNTEAQPFTDQAYAL
jgi:hypothetical protein